MGAEDKAAWVAGAAVFAAIGVAGAAMAVVRRVIGRSPHLPAADRPLEPFADEAMEESVESET